MENSMEVLKNLRIELPYESTTPLLVSTPQIENIYWERYTHPSFTAALFSDQDMKTTKVSFTGYLDEENVVLIYYGILLRYKKWWIITICDNMDGPW